MYKITKVIQSSPAVKKMSGHKAIVKKNMNLRWWSRNGCDGRLMAKILLMRI